MPAGRILRQKRRFRAWVVYWNLREDKVEKQTGTVITLLPSRYSTDTVGKIIEALYCAYWCTYDGQFGYIMGRNRGEKLSRTTFDGRVEIGRNPGLNAVLAEDVCVEVVSTDGNKQIISWTDPDYYEPRGRQRPVRVGSGQFHKLKFDYQQYVQNEVA